MGLLWWRPDWSHCIENNSVLGQCFDRFLNYPLQLFNSFCQRLLCWRRSRRRLCWRRQWGAHWCVSSCASRKHDRGHLRSGFTASVFVNDVRIHVRCDAAVSVLAHRFIRCAAHSRLAVSYLLTASPGSVLGEACDEGAAGITPKRLLPTTGDGGGGAGLATCSVFHCVIQSTSTRSNLSMGKRHRVQERIHL